MSSAPLRFSIASCWLLKGFGTTIWLFNPCSELHQLKTRNLVAGIFVPEVSWTIADTFFSAFVASLPALNALVETSWRKTMSIGTGKSKPYATRSGSGHSRPGAPRRLDSEAGHERLGSQSKVSGLAQKSNDSQFSRIDGEEQGRDSVGDGPMNKGSDLRYTMRAKDVELV